MKTVVVSGNSEPGSVSAVTKGHYGDIGLPIIKTTGLKCDLLTLPKGKGY